MGVDSDFTDFDYWRAEFGQGVLPAGTGAEEIADRAARWLVEHRWTMAAPVACVQCGKASPFRDPDGVAIHPTCMDDPPGPFWFSTRTASLELPELLARLRGGFGSLPPGQSSSCMVCGKPCDAVDPAGVVRHALCPIEP